MSYGNLYYTFAIARANVADSSSQIVAIEGASGTGKTRLAAEYTARYSSSQYPGGVFWFDLSQGVASLNEQQWRAAEILQPSMRNDQTGAASFAHVLKEQVRIAGPALIVVDDYPLDADFMLLNTLLPRDVDASLLVTSQRRLSLTEDSICAIELSGLTLEDGVRLLRGDERDNIDTQSWSMLASRMGSLPLALVVLQRAFAATESPIHLLTRLQGSATAVDEASSAAALLSHTGKQGTPVLSLMAFARHLKFLRLRLSARRDC